jgi:hypothetical protein
MAENLELTTEEKNYIFRTIRTVIFNVADCWGLLSYYETPDSKLDIVKETLKRDLEYLMKLDDFVKDKLK